MGSSNVPTRKYITWRDVDRASRSIVQQLIKKEYEPTHIIGIGRGGIIPAAIVTYQLSVLTGVSPEVGCIYARSYTGKDETQRGELTISSNDIPALQSDNTRILIVDDITDSGSTLMALESIFPTAKTAVLFHKTCSKYTPHYTGPVEPDGEKFWYVFPWERRQNDQKDQG